MSARLQDEGTNHEGCLLSALKGAQLADGELIRGRDLGVGERATLGGRITRMLVHDLPETGRLLHDAGRPPADGRGAQARAGLDADDGGD